MKDAPHASGGAQRGASGGRGSGTKAEKFLRIGDRGRGLPSDRAALDAETNKDAKWERSARRLGRAYPPDISLDACSERAHDQLGPRHQRKAFGLSTHPFNSSPFEWFIPSLRRMSGERKPVRTLVQPPPCSRCELCGGELLLKRIERASLVLDLENELFVCANCGHEKSYAGHHDPYMPHTKVA